MRINFFGGPSSGKSTTASWIFSEMKMKRLSVELVTEYVKAWTYLKRPVGQFDQLYLFGKQLQYEYRFLNGGVEHIVTDSPLFLSYCYAKKYVGEEVAKPLLELEQFYSKTHPSLDIYLVRGDKPYDKAGRYQSEDEAREMDLFISEEIGKHKPSCVFANYKEREKILEHILKNI